jgi:hypothetical protein
VLKYILASLILVSCHSASGNEEVISKDLLEALKNNDTTLAKEIAQKELDKTRASVTDSSFAALLDANLALQSFEFRIEKIKVENILKAIPDSLILNNDLDSKLYSYVSKVYGLVVKKATNQNDILYYSTKMSIPLESWIDNNFRNKTIKELKISTHLIQKDLAIASAIINNVDSKQVRQQTEDSYNQIIKILKEN